MRRLGFLAAVIAACAAAGGAFADQPTAEAWALANRAAQERARNDANEQAERWYVLHFGAEACVPLDDIDFEHARRLYYGTGSIHTPSEYEAFLFGHGVEIADPTMGPNGQTFGAYLDGLSGPETRFVFFTNPDACRAMKAALDASGAQ